MMCLSACAQLERLTNATVGGSSGDWGRESTGDSGAEVRSSGGSSAATTLSREGLPPPLFGEWWFNYPESMKSSGRPKDGPCTAVEPFIYRTPNTYVPVNVPGGLHGGPSYQPGGWYSWYVRCLAIEMDRVGAPIAVLIRERNCPFPFATGGKKTSPGEVAALLDAVPKLDYLIMDLEATNGGTPEDIEKNVAEIVRQVRAHHNPRVRDAYIGNYADWPGRRDEARIWPDRRDRTETSAWKWNRDAFYRRYLNLAMPVAYPYEVHSRHTHREIQKGPTSPNNRAAIFWAPIERVSAAARDLPTGHLLIPWVSNYIDHGSGEKAYNAPPPPRADLEALIRHIRLRGAYSYMVWTANPGRTDHPTITKDQYLDLAMSAWSTLDPLFEESSGDPARVLNLGTDKESGVQWSGMWSGDRVWVLVSNLGADEDARVRLPDIPGVPEYTPTVPRGEHRLFRWRTEG